MLLLLSVAIYIIGVLFWIQHWPYGMKLRLIGCIGIGLFSLFYFSLKSTKSVLDKMALVGLPLVSSSILLRMYHLPYADEFRLFSVIIGLGYGGYLLVQWIPNLKSDSGKLHWGRVAFLVGAIFVGIGVLLKISHLPYASFFLLSGIGFGLVHYFWGMFAKDESKK